MKIAEIDALSVRLAALYMRIADTIARREAQRKKPIRRVVTRHLAARTPATENPES